MKARIAVKREVTQPLNQWDTLCFQEVIYQYENGEIDHGYRFIYRGAKDGKLKAQRGQANLQSIGMVKHMIANAEKAWGLV